MNPRTTLILAVILIGLAAYIYRYETDPIETEPETQYERIFDFEEPDIERIEVRRAEEEDIALERTGEDSWRMLAPLQVDADSTASRALANAAASIERERVIAGGDGSAVNLADFGLDEPQLELEVAVKDASEPATLLIGEQTPTGSNIYGTVAGSDQVFVMAESAKFALEKTGWDLRDKRVLRFNRNDVERVVVRLPETQFTLERASADFWKVAEPVRTIADRYKTSGFVSMLESTRMQELVAESEDNLGQYGLDSPTYEVEVLLSDGSSDTLLIGDQVDTNYYARNPDRPLVYLVGESAINDIRRGESEYISRRLFAFATYQANKVQIESAGEATRVYEKVQEDGQDAWKQTAPEARDMGGSVVDDLLYKLNGTDAEELLAEGPELASPSRTITVWSNQSENVEELVVGQGMEDGVYAQRNGDEMILKLGPSDWEEIETLMQMEATDEDSNN